VNLKRAFAPCSIGNVGPGFDVFGLALEGPGDEVEAVRIQKPGVRILMIEGDEGRLPKEADKNTAGIAARETLHLIRAKTGEEFGVELSLFKGLPLNSGLGSSAASAAAAAVAVNALAKVPLEKESLLGPCIEAESAVSGYHADNVAPSLLGGFLVIESMKPLRWSRIIPDFEIPLGIITPDLEVSTKSAREVIPKLVDLPSVIEQLSSVSTMLCGLYEKDLLKLSRGIDDHIIEPARAELVEGFAQVKIQAMTGGALCFSLSGSGPTIFFTCADTNRVRKLLSTLKSYWGSMGVKATAREVRIDSDGARVLD
jgi:homoserine kinase